MSPPSWIKQSRYLPLGLPVVPSRQKEGKRSQGTARYRGTICDRQPTGGVEDGRVVIGLDRPRQVRQFHIGTVPTFSFFDVVVKEHGSGNVTTSRVAENHELHPCFPEVVHVGLKTDCAVLVHENNLGTGIFQTIRHLWSGKPTIDTARNCSNRDGSPEAVRPGRQITHIDPDPVALDNFPFALIAGQQGVRNESGDSVAFAISDPDLLRVTIVMTSANKYERN